jgi:biotin carboxylase
VLLDQDAAVFSAVSLRSCTAPPHFATTAHLVPAELPGAASAALLAGVTALAAEVGYRRGPLTVTAVLGADGMSYPMGMSIQAGGDGLAEAIESAYGVDVVEAAIAFAVGETVRPQPRRPRPALVRLLSSDRAGTLREITGIAAATALPEIADLQLFTEPGTRVEPYERADRKLGRVVISGGPVAGLWAADAAVRDTLRLRLDGTDEPVALS